MIQYKRSTWLFRIALALCCTLCLHLTQTHAQQYDGMTGLVHTPTAEMSPELNLRLGGHFLQRGMTPWRFQRNGKPYETYSYYIGFTPLSWIEVAYTEVLFKTQKPNSERVGYFQKDRHFSFKVRPFKEGKYWPAVAIGTMDPLHQEWSGERGSQNFACYYVAFTKHIDAHIGEFGLHGTLRKYKGSTKNSQWDGPVGGLTFRPACYKDIRLIAEYNGDQFILGTDVKLFRLLKAQASYMDGYISAGLCLNLQL